MSQTRAPTRSIAIARRRPKAFIASTPRRSRLKSKKFETSLSRTIESEIIPRLLMALRPAAPAIRPVDPTVADGDEVAVLVDILIRHPLQEAQRAVDAMRARGVTAETVVADVLPAAARHVGWLWETDACTFVDVTFALSRLQQLLRHYAPSMGAESPVTGGGRRVLLSVMPGEQHTFGVGVVEEFLRRAAWDVVPIVPATPRDLCRAVQEEWFDIIGLSAAADGSIDAMMALIPQLRGAIKSPTAACASSPEAPRAALAGSRSDGGRRRRGRLRSHQRNGADGSACFVL